MLQSSQRSTLYSAIATAERQTPNMLLHERGAYYGACLHPMQCNPLHLASKIRGPDVPSGLPVATHTMWVILAKGVSPYIVASLPSGLSASAQ